MVARPSVLVPWTDGNVSKVTEPSGAKKLLGFTPEEKPSPFEFNWQLHFLGLWIEFLDQEIAATAALKNAYDATVGAGGDYADINAVMTAMDGVTLPVQDVRILVKDPLTITTTQVVDKPGVVLVFHPKALIAKGTGALGLQLDAERCKVDGGRFMNFSVGGDKAIELTANAKNCFIINNSFLNNDTEIDSALGSNNIITNNITEI